MKKLVLALAATAALSSAAFAQNSSDANIEISGTINESACSMKIKSIDFQSMSIREFAQSGATTGWKSTDIVFADCELSGGAGGNPIDSVDLEVRSGFAADGSADYWANNGTAQNVGVELEVNNTSVKPAGEKFPALQLVDGKKVPVRARLVATGTVEAGSVETAIGVVANYK